MCLEKYLAKYIFESEDLFQAVFLILACNAADFNGVDQNSTTRAADSALFNLGAKRRAKENRVISNSESKKQCLGDTCRLCSTKTQRNAVYSRPRPPKLHTAANDPGSKKVWGNKQAT